jgi:hypothetical protein
MSRIYDDHLHIMEVQGGSFVKALAHLFCMADGKNKPRVRAAFPEYFEEYERRYRDHVASTARHVPADDTEGGEA